ncbi:sigma-54 interaction domain, ATP-binding site 1 [Vibrio phage 1.170.O._10N.261.52.C3]|nr:sigma-54 interaction domain, ATP-binding site 1 [Vibrio phage 1.170.O._10N.261.52.C3]
MVQKNYYIHSDGVHQSTFDRLVFLLEGAGTSIPTYNVAGNYTALHSVDSAPYWIIGPSYFSTNRTKLSWSLSHPSEYEWAGESFTRVDIELLIDKLEYYLEEICHSQGQSGSGTVLFTTDELPKLRDWTKSFIKTDSKEGTELNKEGTMSSEKKTPTKKAISKEDMKPPQFQFSKETQPFVLDMKFSAREGKYGKVIGLDNELEQVILSLNRMKKGNPILVGEAGTGKTTVVEALAQKMVEDESFLEGCGLFEIDCGAITAGCQYRGQKEKRVENIFNEFERHGKAIVFIDEIHSMMGNTSKENDSIATLIKKRLTGGDIRVIGATTYQEYKNIFSKDAAIKRRFQKIEVVEPSEENTVEILKGLRRTYQGYHGVQYSNKTIQDIVHYSTKYLQGHNPDRSVDIMDICGVAVKRSGKKVVTPKVVMEVISKKARIPLDTLGDNVDYLPKLETNLKSNIFGQDHAVKSLVRKIKVHQAGFGAENKPIASMLLTGQSGSGKTELCQQLVRFTGKSLLRLDMSEYSEKASLSSLIGSAKGYIGSEDGGVLTNFITRNPDSVILLDEVEKAHPEILQVFLGIMDNGFLTARDGALVDFRNTLLVYTSNAGVRASEDVKQGIGFFAESEVEKKEETIEEGIKQVFAPEFRARLSDIIQFNPLDKGVMSSIVDKFLSEVEEKLPKGVTLEVTDSAKEWFAEEGYSDTLGARPCKGLIYSKVVEPLAELILGGEAKSIVVDVSSEEGIVIERGVLEEV